MVVRKIATSIKFHHRSAYVLDGSPTTKQTTPMKQSKTLKLPIFCAIYLAVIVASIVIDQLTKYLIFDQLLGGVTGKSVPVLGKFLQFSSVLNSGAAFGMGNSQASDIVFFVVTVVGIPLFCYLLLRSRTRSVLSQVSFALIIGGTIGNAIDRGFYATEGTFFSGKVRDFISFSIFPPVFNFADMCLTIGVFMAIAAIIYFDPDSLVKLMIEERLQKIAQQTAQTDAQNTQPTVVYGTADVVDTQVDDATVLQATDTLAPQTDASTHVEVTDENDTTD